MAIKTLQFYGMGYAEEGFASIVVTLNGSTVYTGNVTSKSILDFNRHAGVQEILFTIDVDESMYGTFPMTIQVTNGTQVDVERILVNTSSNPLTFLSVAPTQDPRTDVMLDGIPQSKGGIADTFPASATWAWGIPNASTLSHNFIIEEIIEETP
jgi:hypothetical protein